MTPLEELLAADKVHPKPHYPTKREVSRARVAARWVYFIRSEDGPIKIGSALNPWTRFANIRASNSSRLKLIGFVEGGGILETELHRLLAGYRVRGEWFSPEPAVLICIREQLRRREAVVLEKEWLHG